MAKKWKLIEKNQGVNGEKVHQKWLQAIIKKSKSKNKQEFRVTIAPEWDIACFTALRRFGKDTCKSHPNWTVWMFFWAPEHRNPLIFFSKSLSIVSFSILLLT